MRILFMLGSLDSGGAQRVAVNLCNSFVKKGNDVTIMVTKLRDNLYKVDKKINIVALDNDLSKKGILREKYIINQMKNGILKYNPNVIISFLPEPTARILFLKKINRKICKIPVILSVRNDPKIIYKSKKMNFVMKLFYGASDGYVFQTEEAKMFFNKKIQDKSTIILNPINQDFFITPYNGEREKVFVTVGRLTKQKNHKLLINAFNQFHKKYKDFKLYIYGEGELKDNLQQQIIDLNLEKSVILKGVSKKIQNEINDKYAFILSSDFEGLPNALMEAMALGLPCISTNCTGGGAAMLIENQENGLIIPCGDANELANAMEKLATNIKFAEKMGKEAIKIREKCSNEQITEEWLNYIKDVLVREE